MIDWFGFFLEVKPFSWLQLGHTHFSLSFVVQDGFCVPETEWETDQDQAMKSRSVQKDSMMSLCKFLLVFYWPEFSKTDTE